MRLLGRSIRSWQNNIKIEVRSIAFENVYWIKSAYDMFGVVAAVNTIMYLRVQLKEGNSTIGRTTIRSAVFMDEYAIQYFILSSS
jgi:hypothetical protein